MLRFVVNLAVIMLAAASVACAQQYKNATPQEAKAMIGKGNVVVVDVRTPQEWNAGHLSGAVLVDFYDANFESNINRVGKDKQVVVYCARGGRSASATEKMASWGWKNVTNMTGGYQAWSAAGLPTTTK
ncbi:MAG: rhodanese-like domain-containing protein [Ignavibacteria bacterium]|nr:rhodanese-like domain-containing protein [Ignavibacteria bacterium]